MYEVIVFRCAAPREAVTPNLSKLTSDQTLCSNLLARQDMMVALLYALRGNVMGLCLLYFVLQIGLAQERFSTRQIPSRFLGSSRRVQVFLPETYARETQRRYPVLYLHDGQNVFSTAGTNVAFGWGNW